MTELAGDEGFVPDPAHKSLLSQFVSAASSASIRTREIWESALRCSVEAALKNLLSHQLLVPADVIQILPAKFGTSELRSLAKQRSIPVSGTKDALANRLVEADEAGMKKLVTGDIYLSCSEKGLAVVKDFESEEHRRKRSAEEDSLRALANGSIETACRLVAQYEATRIFPRGLNIDWHTYNPSGDLGVLTPLFSKVPKCLSSLQSNWLGELRVAAAMQFLWGTKSPSPWITQPVIPEYELDSEVAAANLLSHARAVKHLISMRESGIAQVEILGTDPDACEECQEQAGKVYALAQVPEIPFENCTCVHGCGCIYLAKLED